MVFFDEGDLILERETMEALALAKIKKIVLLSALPRSSWSPTQEMAFRSFQNGKGKYADASCIFPVGSQTRPSDIQGVLPVKPEDIVSESVGKSK